MANSQTPKLSGPRGWADEHIAALDRGETVSYLPVGKSMIPLVNPGQQVTVVPLPTDREVTTEDIVMVLCDNGTFLNRVAAIAKIGDTRRYLITNVAGRHNGWVTRDRIRGLLIKSG